jgi:C4-dicarboxylate-specific signal transduction histidine kinase
MGDIINTVLDLSSEKFKTSGIELIIDKYDIQEPLNCRPVQIAQVILNLLMNSYDAVENLREKWVKVSINQKENSLVISITDSGTGIPVSIRNQIMLPFFTTKSTGAGIGLSTSKMILEDHKAELNYDDTCSNTKFDLIFKRS